MPQIQITCDTSDTSIYYSINNDNLDQLYSTLFEVNTTSTIRAIGRKDGYEDSDVSNLEISVIDANNLTIPYTLPDNTTIFYDRGTEYGNYQIINNKLTRLSEGVDDQTVESQNWRYLVGYPDDTWLSKVTDNPTIYPWGPEEDATYINDKSLGAGLPNTNKLIELYGDNPNYPWYYVKKYRELDNKNWSVYSINEWAQLPGSSSYPTWCPLFTIKTESGNNPGQTWSSCEYEVPDLQDQAYYLRYYMRMYFNGHKRLYYDSGTRNDATVCILYRI